MQDNENSTGCEVTSNSYKASLATTSMNWNNNNPVFIEHFEPYSAIFTPLIPNIETNIEIHKPKKGYGRIIIIIAVILLGIYLKQ